MRQSKWEKGQGCCNAIAIPVLILCGIASPFVLIAYLRHPDPEITLAAVACGIFVLLDLAALAWFIDRKMKERAERKRVLEKYHSRFERARAASDAGGAKYMRICPRCLWIPHSAYDWIEHKGTEQETCYYCGIPLETTNCTEEEFNRSDELKELVFEYFAAQKAYDKETYEMRVRNDLALKRQMLERRRREGQQQNQQRPQGQPSQPSQPSQPTQGQLSQPSQPTPPPAPAQPPLPTLTTCPVCRGKVSTAATACPHCGQPLHEGKIASR